MSTYYIREVTKRIDHKNPITGHEWATYENTGSYEVAGGRCMPNRFKSLKKAQEHKAGLERLDKIAEEIAGRPVDEKP